MENITKKWFTNKTFFKYLIKQNYKIIKDIKTNDVLDIIWDKYDIKCKYFLAFTVDENNNIIWSDSNPFIDQKTRYLSQIIKKNIIVDKIDSTIYSDKIMDKIKIIIKLETQIKLEEEQINFLWCLVGKFGKYKQYYIITDIIHY